ncbi:endonuclease/exonuclease/phosphatase family protein [Leptospira levettii]|uniref:endonuclease/exonuclease/phosphatase family protein n=1 Tax=Leptospira levettii TaxID=2023178 RepID=UPI000C2ADDA8|nr:endonuclease/exonuclease/phosphatase family protein [Leptospira levettii]PKA22706.1 endonuclease/exonuclease/phosphatase [Leptospira sp. mixed culture ATI2-C-A1]TGM82525.1 endonuclease/exonuclease/phosphatase family protein [Leptospira levettii]
MKIVSWNCSGGFRKKYHKIQNINPEIIIIQECENPDLYKNDFDSFNYKNFIWEGENKNKGIAVFTKNINQINKLNWNNSYTLNIPEITSTSLSWNSSELKQFLPFSINDEFSFLAVWTKGRENLIFGYIGQFWKYILANKSQIIKHKPFIIGDFNSNSIWDKRDRWWNHSEIVSLLDTWNYKSLYHQFFSEKQGNESIPTFYLQRNIEKSYHIDYAFLPSDKADKSKIEIGKFKDWIDLSDHLPIIIDFQN